MKYIFKDLSKNWDVFKYGDNISPYLNQEEYETINNHKDAIIKILNALDEKLNAFKTIKNHARIMLSIINNAVNELVNLMSRENIGRYAVRNNIINLWLERILNCLLLNKPKKPTEYIKNVIEFLGSQNYIYCYILSK